MAQRAFSHRPAPQRARAPITPRWRATAKRLGADATVTPAIPRCPRRCPAPAPRSLTRVSISSAPSGVVLPERCLVLVVHQELAGLKAPPRCAGGHHPPARSGRAAAATDAVDTSAARMSSVEGLRRDGLDRLLGHAGMVLELHRADALAVVAVANRADEAGHGADARVVGAQCGHFGAEVEVLVWMVPRGAFTPASGHRAGRTPIWPSASTAVTASPHRLWFDRHAQRNGRVPARWRAGAPRRSAHRVPWPPWPPAGSSSGSPEPTGRAGGRSSAPGIFMTASRRADRNSTRVAPRDRLTGGLSTGRRPTRPR